MKSYTFNQHVKQIPQKDLPTPQKLNRIYTEGCFSGRDQIDPTTNALDETVDVLNPYHTPEERHHWTQGFKDAIYHMVKHYKKYN